MEMPVKEKFMTAQPNLNADIYRNSNAAKQMLRAPNIEFLKIYTDNTTLVGSSDLTGRFWNGAATINKTPQDAIETYSKKDRQQLHVESGVTDGCFLDSTKIALCEDSGCLSIWMCGSETSKWLSGKWTITESVTEHDDSILTIDIIQPPLAAITGSNDGCIKVWDFTDMVAKVSYNDAHHHSVNHVATKPNSASIFASCSLDKNVTLWDTSTSSKVKDVATLRCGARCFSWYSENELLCGSDAGDIILVDIRGGQGDSDKGVVKHYAEFPKSLHRIVKSSHGDLVGLTCDSNILYVVKILDDDSMRIVYENASHEDYVRALSFDLQNHNTVYSGSWDGSIIAHNVSELS